MEAGRDLSGFSPVERQVVTQVSFGWLLTPSVFAERRVGLEPVLPDWPGIPVPLSRIAHREVPTSRCIRIMVDVLALGRG